MYLRTICRAVVPRGGLIYIRNAGGGTGQSTHPVTFDLLYRNSEITPELVVGNLSRNVSVGSMVLV